MQIQLKQPEIVAALKQYLAGQGIVLAGKHVEISFTAGRKEAGTSADISIEDNDFPIIPVDGTKVALTVVKTEAAPVQTDQPVDVPKEAVAEGEPVPPIAGKSLFG